MDEMVIMLKLLDNKVEFIPTEVGWNKGEITMMLVEKLARYDMAPGEVFDRLEAAWKKQKFVLRFSYKNYGEMVHAGNMAKKLRVDVKTKCIMEGEGTIVQMIYSPAVTPLTLRPGKLSDDEQKQLLQDIKHKMAMVLNDVGSWELVTRMDIHDHPELLEDTSRIQLIPKKAANRKLMLFGLGIAVFGLVLYLLSSSEVIGISSELGKDAAFVGLGVIGLGFLKTIWEK